MAHTGWWSGPGATGSGCVVLSANPFSRLDPRLTLAHPSLNPRSALARPSLNLRSTLTQPSHVTTVPDHTTHPPMNRLGLWGVWEIVTGRNNFELQRGGVFRLCPVEIEE